MRQVAGADSCCDRSASRLLLASVAGVQSRRFGGVVARVQIVTVRQVRLMRRLLMSACPVVRTRLRVVLRRVFKMLGCLLVMFNGV